MLTIAHLSDTHLDGGSRSTGRAMSVANYLRDLPGSVDAIVVTGDIADNGEASEYEMAQAIFSFDCPVFFCPGNHDHRQEFVRGLLASPSPDSAGDDDSPVNQVCRAGGVIFAMCDSTIAGQVEGYLSDDTLGWLDGVLTENADCPALICFHHPPVMLHAPFVDSLRQGGTDRLERVIAKHPQVAAILSGHAHTAAATTFAGRPLRVAPGVVSTLRLPWESGGPFDDELPPALAFHVIDDDARLTTHYRSLP
ncbi:MAG TPA: metallophosphoesterase [Streptosporangiaceae bacterium]|nr:metallophosphoesterase [Streptosporangiaceae bacterium]